MTEQWQHLGSGRNLTDYTFLNSLCGKRHVAFLSSWSNWVKKTITFLIWLWSSGCSSKTKVRVQSQAPVAPEQDPEPQSVPVSEWTRGGNQWSCYCHYCANMSVRVNVETGSHSLISPYSSPNVPADTQCVIILGSSAGMGLASYSCLQ